MEHAARRSALTIAALTTAGALALAPISVAPHAVDAPLRISTQSVQLTDAWSDLLANTVTSTFQLGAMALGLDSNYPLPYPTIPLAPVATQLVLNQLIYVAKLFNGQAGEIPAYIGAHLTEVGNVAQLIIAATPGVVLQQLQVPFQAAQEAVNSIGSSGNILTGLIEAPAVFLDGALNSQFGLLGITGPIGISIIFRNLLAVALYTPPPTIVLPFKKPAAASAAKTTTTTKRVTPKAPSGTASSGRSKPKAPANSSRKASAAKTGNSSGGQAHSKRG